MTYSTGYVSDHTGATPRQLSTWVSKGWLSSPAPGTGKSREWSREDLYRATIMMRFIEVGIQAERAAKLMRVIADRPNVTRYDDARLRVGPNLWIVIRDLKNGLPMSDIAVSGGVL